MRWLVAGAQPHDALFFHCKPFRFRIYRSLSYCADSGHGGQTPDLDGDEIDGYDEGQLRDESIWLTITDHSGV